MIFLIILFVLILLIFIWFLIEQHLLWVHREEITLSHLPPAFDGTSLLQITDLHHREMGKNNCRIVRKAAELHPDHIVLTGDLISRDMRDFHGIASFLTALSKISPVWICVGNHELDLPPAVWEQLRQTIAQSGCRLLQNQTISLEMPGSVPLYLAGADLAYGVYRDENRKFRNLQPYTAADLENDLGRRRGCTVLLAHNPLLLTATPAGAQTWCCAAMSTAVWCGCHFWAACCRRSASSFPNTTRGCMKKTARKCMSPAASASLGCAIRRRSI